MTKGAKIIVGVVVLAAIGGLGFVSAKKSGTKPVEVRVEAVEARDLVASVTASAADCCLSLSERS